MTEQEDEYLLSEAQDRATEAFGKTRYWALRPDLPDPTYNANNGWSLDQFAMHFEPDLLRLYKDVTADLHRPARTPSKHPPLRWLEVGLELSKKVKSRLLDPGYRVVGLRPGSYDPEAIPRPLLEGMHPRIVISELFEGGVAKPRRRFEKVRIFDQSAAKKTAAGRKATYDWAALSSDLERDGLAFSSDAELVEHCRTNVKPAPGKQASKDGPDDKTVRAAIAKYDWRKFVQPKK